MPRVLIACEFSGIVRDAFLAKGIEAYSCDIIDGEPPSPFHIKGDVTELLSQRAVHLGRSWSRLTDRLV